MHQPLILASASPRRAELIQTFGVPVMIEPAAIDESPHADESAHELIRRVAYEKAIAVHNQYPEAYILGADTGVVVDHQFLGKPSSADAAKTMLQMLSGRSHEVSSAVVLVSPQGEIGSAFVTTTVWFATLPVAWIDAYVASGDPMDKAGGYAIQHAAGLFVSRLEGSYSNVVGLPLYETGQLLRRAGLWHPDQVNNP